jgi:two-component sensor histidine kinase
LHADGSLQDRIRLSGPRILLAPRAAVAIAMALHELCTNAVKYGALSCAAGHVNLTWRTEDNSNGERLKMLWREEGGPNVSPPTRRGFGSLLLERSLAHDLEGKVTLDFRPDGLLCDIDAPTVSASGAQN